MSAYSAQSGAACGTAARPRRAFALAMEARRCPAGGPSIELIATKTIWRLRQLLNILSACSPPSRLTSDLDQH